MPKDQRQGGTLHADHRAEEFPIWLNRHNRHRSRVVGLLLTPNPIVPQSVRSGDAVILGGDIDRHGIAIMATHEVPGFETMITSDCIALTAPVRELLLSGIDFHCLRDRTRGGLAIALKPWRATVWFSSRRQPEP